MKTFVVVNPASANGLTGRRWLDIESKMRREVGECAFAFTREPLDAERLTRRALQEGFERVVAVGGDGTLNEVTNGFFEGGRAVAPSASLCVVPRGTGGDFRRTFGWDLDLTAALQRAAGARARPIDVGKLDYTGHDGRPATRLFINVCSFGVSGVVDQEVNRSTKVLGGRVSFMLGSVRALLKYTDRTVRLSLDGAPSRELKVTTVAVANGRYFGGGMCVAPEADPSDGTFDVTVWSGFGVKDFALKSRSLYDGTHVRLSGTQQFRCQRLEASSDDEVLLDVDGEQPGRLPCTMTVLPGALNLQV